MTHTIHQVVITSMLITTATPGHIVQTKAIVVITAHSTVAAIDHITAKALVSPSVAIAIVQCTHKVLVTLLIVTTLLIHKMLLNLSNSTKINMANTWIKGPAASTTITVIITRFMRIMAIRTTWRVSTTQTM